MPEYIEREAVIKRLEASPLIKNYLIMRGRQNLINGIIDLIKRQPTADVVEVRHGEWIYCPETINLRSHFYCSACNGIRLEHYTKNNFRYCPNCGAKMDGKGVDYA